MKVLLFVLFLMPSLSLAANVYGEFKVVKGTVEVISKNGKRQKAKLGLRVFPQDKVVTGKDSRAKIVMVDKNELNVTPDSEIQIAKYEYKPEAGKKNVSINVLYGKIRAKVNQKYEGDNKFQVKTPSAVAGVRGTDFFTAYNPTNNATRVVTFEGRVEFGLPGANGAILKPVFVGVGQTAASLAGAAPTQPVQVPKTELADFDQNSNASTAPNSNSNQRTPSSVRPGRPDDRGMLRPEDTIDQNNPPIPPSGPQLLPPAPPPRPPGPNLPKCDFCQTVIQDGTRALILNVHHTNPAEP